MENNKLLIIAFVLVVLCSSSCSSKFDKPDLANRIWRSDNGQVIYLYDNDSCKIEHYLKEHNTHVVNYGTWFFDRDKQRVYFEMKYSDTTGGWVFHLELMSQYDITPTKIDELQLGEFLSDPDDFNVLYYEQVTNNKESF